MKYIIQINQKSALKLGLTNFKHAHIFDFLTTAATWADAVVVENEVYYWVARSVIREQLAMLNYTDDSIYRALKALDKMGLINYKKDGIKDLIQITEKGKKYLFDNYGIEAPENMTPKQAQDAQKKLDNKLKVEKVAQMFGLDISLLKEFISYRRAIKKAIKTQKALMAFARELKAIKDAGIDPKAAIELMQEREWQSIKLEWVNKYLKTVPNLNQVAQQEYKVSEDW